MPQRLRRGPGPWERLEVLGKMPQEPPTLRGMPLPSTCGIPEGKLEAPSGAHLNLLESLLTRTDKSD